MTTLSIDMLPMRARKSDPQTSKAAAIKSAEFAASHAGIIHLALVNRANATADELAAVTGLTVVQICRRLPELERMGLIRVAFEDGAAVTRGGFRAWEAVQ